MINSQDSKGLIDTCKFYLSQTMADVIQGMHSKSGAMVSYAEIERIDALTKLVKNFISLLPKDTRQALVQDILMKPENFKHCDKNCLPIKIFRDMLLQGGVSFDVQSLFVGEDYAWLASLLLSTENMTSLNNLPDLKR
jgi:hypothetical protein